MCRIASCFLAFHQDQVGVAEVKEEPLEADAHVENGATAKNLNRINSPCSACNTFTSLCIFLCLFLNLVKWSDLKPAGIIHRGQVISNSAKDSICEGSLAMAIECQEFIWELVDWLSEIGALTLRLELHEVLSARKTLFFQVCIIASSFTGLNHSPCSCRCFLQTRKAGSRAPEAFQSYGAFGMASIGWRATPCTKFGHISRCP